MEDSTSGSRRVHASESGRILTSEEAALLLRSLLGTKPSDARPTPWMSEASDARGPVKPAKDAS